MLQLDVPAGPVQPVGAAASSVLPAGQDAQQGMNPRQQHPFEPPTLAIWYMLLHRTELEAAALAPLTTLSMRFHIQAAFATLEFAKHTRLHYTPQHG